MRIALLLGILLLLAGCPDGRQPPPADPVALQTRLGQAGCVAASLLVRTVPPEGEGEQFSLRLWADGEGRIRVLAQKLDVDFLAALVEADGSYRAHDPRSGTRTAGRLGATDDPALLRDLALLVGEARHGPVPPGATVRTDAAGAWRFAVAGGEAVVAFAADLPSGKTLPGRTLAYERWTTFEGLTRPSLVRLRVDGDPTTYVIRLKALDAPGAISAQRMTLAIPDDAVALEPAEFARRLGGAQ